MTNGQPRESQFQKSGRTMMAFIATELALNEPAARRELIRQAIQFLGVRAMEFDGNGKPVDPKDARCPLCEKKLADVTPEPERKLVTLA